MPLTKYADLIYKKIQTPSEGGSHNNWLLSHIRELDCYIWCERTCIGSFNYIIGTTSKYELYLNHFCFEFEREEDAVLFKLIWC
ncbi:MAG: hypothetical protein HC836_35550 [Richelia sp. RM2_1_2]|nr:hypothetical protein [Richelia sp. RM2_1_2]